MLPTAEIRFVCFFLSLFLPALESRSVVVVVAFLQNELMKFGVKTTIVRREASTHLAI